MLVSVASTDSVPTYGTCLSLVQSSQFMVVGILGHYCAELSCIVRKRTNSVLTKRINILKMSLAYNSYPSVVKLLGHYCTDLSDIVSNSTNSVRTNSTNIWRMSLGHYGYACAVEILGHYRAELSYMPGNDEYGVSFLFVLIMVTLVGRGMAGRYNEALRMGVTKLTSHQRCYDECGPNQLHVSALHQYDGRCGDCSGCYCYDCYGITSHNADFQVFLGPQFDTAFASAPNNRDRRRKEELMGKHADVSKSARQAWPADRNLHTYG